MNAMIFLAEFTMYYTDEPTRRTKLILADSLGDALVKFQKAYPLATKIRISTPIE
jgi:hypothetical protein